MHTQEVSDAWYGFGRSRVIGAKRFHRLRLLCQGDVEAAWRASIPLLAKALGEKTAHAFAKERACIDIAAERTSCQASDIEIVPFGSQTYPELLSEIHDPPPLLYCRGDIDALRRPCVSMVGTRRASTYGKQAARRIAQELAQAGLVVASGLAYGIDITAHRACLEVGAATIAVLPGGLDDASIAPRQHATAAHQIHASGGLLLSEYAPGTSAHKGHFPVRNRIIAGLSRVTVVVEAAVASGTMITASAALSENRDVGAVPGPVTSLGSAGPHQLIKEGATLITCAQDIIELMDISCALLPSEIPNLTEQESLVWEQIEDQPTSIDDIVRALAGTAGQVTGVLMQLELKSCIAQAGAGHVVRTAIKPRLHP